VAPAAADDEEEEEAEGEGAAERGEDFAVGSRVVLHGLKRAAQVSELSKQALTAADRRRRPASACLALCLALCAPLRAQSTQKSTPRRRSPMNIRIPSRCPACPRQTAMEWLGAEPREGGARAEEICPAAYLSSPAWRGVCRSTTARWGPCCSAPAPAPLRRPRRRPRLPCHAS
jgi:hypothetical protein